MKWHRPPGLRDANGKTRSIHGLTVFNSKNMYIHPNKIADEFADTMLHECTHACFPDLDEVSVTDFVASFFTLFIRAGGKITFDERQAKKVAK